MGVVVSVVVQIFVRGVCGFEIDLAHRGSPDATMSRRSRAAKMKGTEEMEVPDMKCVSEEIHANAVVLFTFETNPTDDLVSMRLYDPEGNVMFSKEDSNGSNHGFTTQKDGDYRACFYKPEYASITDAAEKNEALSKHRVRVDWKHGVAATEWKKLAKATDMDAFTKTLRALEADLSEVHQGMLSLRQLEADMRDMNEATNTKVAWMSVLSLSVCVGMALWQIYYLKGFFERKKML